MNTLNCPVCAKPLSDDAPQGICPSCLLQQAMQHTDTSPQPLELELQQLAAAFPQLVIEEMIGQGGMGRVYRAQQPHLNRTVALKSKLSRLLHLWRCSSSPPANGPQGLVEWLDRQGGCWRE